MEAYDDQTLLKARKALIQSGLTEEQADQAINEVLNAGLLFRERV